MKTKSLQHASVLRILYYSINILYVIVFITLTSISIIPKELPSGVVTAFTFSSESQYSITRNFGFHRNEYFSSKSCSPHHNGNDLDDLLLSSKQTITGKLIEENFNEKVDYKHHDQNHRTIFKGKHKWLGGAVDIDNNAIYGIPSHSKELICLKQKRQSSSSLPSDKSRKEPEMEYEIHTIPLPTNIAAGKFKWLRGIISNNFLYGIPAWSYDGVFKVDLIKLWNNNKKETKQNSVFEEKEQENNDAISTIPLPEDFFDPNIYVNNHKNIIPSTWLWHGAALNANQTAIYCIPSNAQHVLKIDLLTSTTTLLPIPNTTSNPLELTNKWYGGILGLDNAIYGVPYAAGGVLRIDAHTDEVEILGDYGVNKYNWHGGLLCKENGSIYCFPAHNSEVLKIDTSIDSSRKKEIVNRSNESEKDSVWRMSLLPVQRASYDHDNVTRYKWLGGTLGADGNIYGMPSDASSILKIDTQLDTAKTFGIVSGEKNKWQGGTLSEDGLIYAIPSNNKHILCLDTNKYENDRSDDIGADLVLDQSRYHLIGDDLPPVKDKWQGGFLGKDGSIYCIPENFDRVMKVTCNDGKEDVSFF